MENVFVEILDGDLKGCIGVIPLDVINTGKFELFNGENPPKINYYKAIISKGVNYDSYKGSEITKKEYLITE